jgi:GNAT superfamily N-acetyltransferase
MCESVCDFSTLSEPDSGCHVGALPFAVMETAPIDVRPATAERWEDLAALFGEKGASSGCWCQWFRVRNADWQRNAGGGNRRALRSQVEGDLAPGLLAYRDDRCVGWISLAPRRDFERIAGDAETAFTEETAEPSRVPIWSIVCFYTMPGGRGEGVASALLDAAIHHARASGARTLEAYPSEPRDRISNADAFMGLRTMFDRAGFRETGRFDTWRAVPLASGDKAKPVRRLPGRPVMRLELG